MVRGAPPFKGEAEGKDLAEKWSEVCVAKEGNAIKVYRWRRLLAVTFA